MNDSDMFPAAKTSDVTLDDKITELERELRTRWHVYPRMVEAQKMNQQTADKQILIIEAIIEDLVRHKKTIGENDAETQSD
jgi:hypothetical protein